MSIEFTPTQTAYDCPNCGNHTAIATNVNQDYPTNPTEKRTLPLLVVIRCYTCKKSTKGYANENLAVAAMSKEMV